MIKRWLQLTYITGKYGFFCLLRVFRFYPNHYPQIIRCYFQEAGGVLVKLGQILALRYEIMPPEYCWELSELFDNVTPMDYATVRQILNTELGKSPNEFFTIFEEQPIASASFAQVHKAVLFDGRTVAVKIQRPDLKRKVSGDFIFLKFLFFLISPIINIRALRLQEVLAEIEELTFKELDYRLEKDNAEIIRKNIADHSTFFIPKTYSEYTTGKVLIQDFVEGIKLNDILRSKRGAVDNQQFEDLNIDLGFIAQEILAELAREYWVVGVYHSDPHPGNIIITKDRKIAFVDFGIVGHVSKYSRAMFWNFIRHIALDLDAKPAAEAFLQLGLRPVEDRVRYLAQDRQVVISQYQQIIKTLASSFEQPLGSIMQKWSNAIGNPSESLYDRSTAVAFLKAMRIAEQYNVHFQRDIIVFIRALVIADMMAMQLSPTFKVRDSLMLFAKREREVLNELENTLANQPVIENEKFLDPWNEDARQNAKEYIFNWFQNMVDDRPSLYQKVKTQSEHLKNSLLSKS